MQQVTTRALPIAILAVVLYGAIACVGRLPDLWFVPLVTVTASCIPASGVPVTGGIVFFPTLHAFGMCTQSVLAFCAIVQSIGAGVITPLVWYTRMPDVFVWPVLQHVAAPCIVGYACAILFPLYDLPHGLHITQLRLQ